MAMIRALHPETGEGQVTCSGSGARVRMRESALVRNQFCGLGDVGPGNLIIFLPSVRL